MRLRPLTHALLIGFTALQVVEPAVTEWADVRLEAVSRTATAVPHFEDPRAARCAPLHLPDCVLCRFLAQPAVAPVRPTPAIPIITGRINTLEAVLVEASRVPAFHPPSRAPPLPL